MRRKGYLKEEFLSFANLFSAYKKAYKSTKNYTSYEFTFYVEREILQLKNDLIKEIYTPRDYRYFKIYDPKERDISVANFRDRVVHHGLVNVLEPVYEKRFIYDSYATRKAKGTHKAIARAQQFLRKNRWYLKMDIRKYFDSINHDILNRIINRSIKDKFITNLCSLIINKGGNGISGLPIGNLTSQFFANVYLDIFDHFVKDKHRIKFYLRYMDDFCVFSSDKELLKGYRKSFQDFLKNDLDLDVKETATLINSRVHGLPFLGVRIFPQLVRLKRDCFIRSYKKLKTKEWQYRNDAIDYEGYHCSMQSLTSHLNYYGKRLLKSKLYSGAVSKADLIA